MDSVALGFLGTLPGKPGRACYGGSVMHFDQVSRSQIHATFQEAFSDYTVDMSSLTEERLQIRCAKNIVDWEVSVGVFDGQRMVGFTLIGIDRWQGGLGAFDAATGIVRDFRGQGLARGMFDHALPELGRRGVETFVLEVITDNEPAIRAYKKAGFEISRRWKCFRLDLTSLSQERNPFGASLPVPIDRRVVGTLSSATDWHPSWENSFGAIGRIPDELICLGSMDGDRCVGTIAYSPAMNWIMTLVVEPSHRRRGVGSGLVHGLVKALPDEVQSTKILNVDASDTGMAMFLERLGFQHLIDQYEMIRPI